MGMDGLVRSVPAGVENLRNDLMRSGRPLPERRVLSVGLGLCAALRTLYAKTDYALHGDLSSSRLYLTQEDEVYLLLPSHGVSGDPLPPEGYCAPEIYGFRADRRTDIYGVGATLWAALAGVDPPFTFPLPDVRTVRPDTSDELADIINRCCRLPADERYQTVDELEVALQSCAASHGALRARGLIVLGGR